MYGDPQIVSSGLWRRSIAHRPDVGGLFGGCTRRHPRQRIVTASANLHNCWVRRADVRRCGD